MPRTGADMARSVHPALVGAAVRTLGAGAGDAGERARAMLGDGEPVPERLNARVLSRLAAGGWPALLAAAERLVASAPPMAELAECRDLPALLGRAALAEGWFHVGHRTHRSLGERELTVRHLPGLGGVPSAPESLFVCALDAVATAEVTGRAGRVTVLADGAAGRPEDVLRGGARRVSGWRIDWADEVAPGGPQPLDALRGRFAREPDRAWRLDGTAALLGLAPRTLQRGLTAAGTSFRAELLAVRLEVAAQLATRTALPLADIAAATGFTDHAHLTRRFTARYGVPPSEFRQQRAGGRSDADSRRAPTASPADGPGTVASGRTSRRATALRTAGSRGGAEAPGGRKRGGSGSAPVSSGG
ncbi:helix-turn-helix transcriptional regulator [Kitasatospora sp. NPDC048365]|uniref:helix-turn-helix transcriptional regulator n=1 Tax=Kitasatospora sp. NPDC048365 TaxID=3364050 RepID=UPI0037194958